MLRRDETYPICDERWRHRNKRAQWTGEKRPPKAGEWYLSGAEICAYKALADLDTPYHIAKLIQVRTRIVTEIIEEATNQ